MCDSLYRLCSMPKITVTKTVNYNECGVDYLFQYQDGDVEYAVACFLPDIDATNNNITRVLEARDEIVRWVNET